jgi:hypothetical protein
VKSGVVKAAALSAVFVFSVAAPAVAQAPQNLPPLPGFVPPYEIARIVRSAGFDPLAPPLRRGATYVVRATDFRGILMRVVVDGRSGAIRAVNRIVAASEAYDPMEMLPSPYAAPPVYADPPAYVEPEPPEFAPSVMVPVERRAAPDLSSAPPPMVPLPAAHPATSGFPPLPRPRPAELASRKAAGESKPVVPKAASAPAAPAAGLPKKQPAITPLPD